MSQKPFILDPNPGVSGDIIGRYVLRRLQAGTIHLYGAYLLRHESLRLRRRWYAEPAWGGTAGILQLLEIYYDYLMAIALQCPAEASEAAAWFVADVPLLSERRPHFLVDRLPQGRALLDDEEFHGLLAKLRQRYDRLCQDDGYDEYSDDDGPFPPDVFPFDLAAPEREVLHPGSEPAFQGPRDLDAETEEAYVQLQIESA